MEANGVFIARFHRRGQIGGERIWRTITTEIRLDTQVVEVLGRQRLVEQLLRAGIEVAEPVRDRGVDLIAYLERGDDHLAFAAFPIQLKACSERAWNIDRKYAAVPGLIIAHVWYVSQPEDTVVYAMTYGEAVNLAEAMGYAASPSWRDGGYYATSSPAARLVEFLERHRMTPERWTLLLRPSLRTAR